MCLLYYSTWLWSGVRKKRKKKPDYWISRQKTVAGFVSARYRNCSVNNPVSVYTEDKIRKHKIYIQYRWLPDYYALLWAAWFYLVLANRRHSSLFFIAVAPTALRSSCIIEISVAAPIIVHANRVCAQRLSGVCVKVSVDGCSFL